MEYSSSGLMYSFGFDNHIIFWSFIIMLLRTKTFMTLHFTRTFVDIGNRTRFIRVESWNGGCDGSDHLIASTGGERYMFTEAYLDMSGRWWRWMSEAVWREKAEIFKVKEKKTNSISNKKLIFNLTRNKIEERERRHAWWYLKIKIYKKKL
jgi:hypothetical protein